MTYCCVLDSIADFMKNSATNKVLATNWESEYLTFYEWKNIVNVKNDKVTRRRGIFFHLPDMNVMGILVKQYFFIEVTDM